LVIVVQGNYHVTNSLSSTARETKVPALEPAFVMRVSGAPMKAMQLAHRHKKQSYSPQR
jgi:hypothetical protein